MTVAFLYPVIQFNRSLDGAGLSSCSRARESVLENHRLTAAATLGNSRQSKALQEGTVARRSTATGCTLFVVIANFIPG
jgi:hypothetical protein